MIGLIQKERKYFTLTTTINKFPDNNFYQETEDYIVICEGFILNDFEVMEKYNQKSILETILFLYKNEKELYREFKGTYVILIWDKKQEKLYLTNDLFSKKSIYYSIQKNQLYFSTSFFEVVKLLKDNNLTTSIDEIALEYMIKNMAFTEEGTYCNEIKYLCPYEHLLWNKNTEIVSSDMPEMLISVDKNQVISNLDKLFNKAVELQVKKNKAMGYKQVCTLSGGMDSRAVFLYLQKNKIKNVLCLTYAQSGSLDETIPQEIATDYHCKHLFHCIDGGNFIADRDKIIQANEGQMMYAGTTGLYGLAENLDNSNIGIVHTGFGGGEIMGDLCNHGQLKDDFYREYFNKYNIPDEEKNFLIEKLKIKYPNANYFVQLNDFRVCLNFAKTSRFFFESSSPFLDEDFYEYLLSLPIQVKVNRKIYDEWYIKYLNSKYQTTRLQGRIGGSKIYYWYNRVMQRLARELKIITKFQMNPFEYWYNNNSFIKNKMDEMYNEDMKELCKQNISFLINNDYQKYDVTRKLNFLTITSVIKSVIKK